MTERKASVRVLSFLLALVMFVGLLPMNALAEEVTEATDATVVTESTEATEATQAASEPAETTEPQETEGDTAPSEEVTEPAKEEIVTFGLERANSNTTTDYLFIATDRHTNTSILATMINAMETKIGENELDYLALGGDMVGSGNSHPTYNSSTVLSEITGATSSLSAANVDIVAGIHDMNVNDDAGIVLPYSGGGAQIYEGNKFYVYGVPESCVSGAVSGVDPQTEANDFVTWANNVEDKTKAIIVVSHYPLHVRRNDNVGAAYWAAALNTVATGGSTDSDPAILRNVAFFWGHNHTSESSKDTAVYHVAPGGSISVQGGSSSQKIYFTYANAGYLNSHSSATLITITDSTITFDKYKNSSVSTSYSVDRVAEAAPTLSSISVSGDTKYYVGDELNLTVTAAYDDGTTADVTAKATFNNDLSASGAYTVTATYTEGNVTKTATIDVKVYLYAEAVIAVEVFSQGTTGLTVTWDDAAEAYLDAVMDDYVVYDLALTNAGETAEYAMTIVEDMDTSALVVYHVAEDGTLTEMDFAVEGDCVVFTTSLTGTFAYGTVSIPSGYELDSLMVTNPKADYLVGQNLYTAGEFAVQAVYTKEGAENFVRTLYVYEPNTNPDGYVLNMDSFDMTAAGSYNVEITYGGKSATFPITVWGDEFTASGVTVALAAEGTEYGVTAVNVSESANEHVATAIADVLDAGYVAYDITLAYSEGYEATEDTKTVTLPIPEGVTNPAVYYVSDDGATVTKMDATAENGYVTFTTTHFSTYVVGENAEIVVPDPETATGSGTTGDKKTVYVLTSSPVAGKSYLIVNGNAAGSYYALANNNGSVAATGVTVKSDSEIGTYIELDDALDELWTVASGYTFKNGSYYLGYSEETTDYGYWEETTSTFGLTTTARSWSYSNNRLSVSAPNGWRNTTYYLRYNDGWTWTDSSNASGRSVYFYVLTEIDDTVTVSGTYSIAGTPAEVTKVVTAGATATLGSTLTFTPTSGSATTTDTSATATYTLVEGGDPNGVISGINGNTVTFTGKTGKALVKVSYTTSFGEVTNYIVVNASEPTYVLDITSGEDVVTGTTMAVKGVTSSKTLQLGTQIQFVDEDGAEIVELPEGATIEWHIPEEYHNIATVGHETGLVSFKGVDGAFYVTATLTVNGKDYTVGVNISATTSSYSVPSDGASDFPEYPNEGAIRFDKTATAVGNFSETGIAQVELSMTGVPYHSGSEIDVVLILDMTGSMDDVTSSTEAPTGYARIDATIAASKAFIKSIVLNEDGTFNANRIGIYVFNKNGASTLFDLGVIDTEAKLQSLIGKIADGGVEFDSNYTNGKLDTIWTDYGVSGGTPYDDGLGKAYEVLNAARTDGTGNNRQQFTVFMTDGVPTDFEYINGTSHANYSSASSIAGMLTSASDYATRDTDYKYEYYSTEMKKAGVTVYSVGVGLFNTNNAWSGTATQCGNLASALLNDISGPAGETVQPDAVGTATLSKKDEYFFSVNDATAGADMTKVFSNIAQKILQAATDVTVEDKITDEYTMIFDIPEGTKDITGVTNDFYIEFGKYALDEEHERIENGFTSITKLYLKNTNGVLSAAKDSTGTAYDAPVFEQKTLGEKGTLYYWSTNASDGDAGISVTVSGTTYYFVSHGMEEAGYNMTSGAYAYGNVDATTNMSEDLVIATPYFVYNAATKMIYWTVDKLDTEECVLRYFLYLDNSATEVGTGKEVDPGSYQTNDHAYITYTNFNGNDCRQEFPKPQLTWSGAQVSYVFYLVNAQGQPINKSGQVVDFANATFVTDVYTEETVWNKGEDGHITADSQLSIDWLADNLLPSDYEVYDENAKYQLHVYGDHTGASIFDYFTIAGSDAAAISQSLNSRLNLNTTASTVSLTTTRVYNTRAGQKVTGYGTYTSEATDSIDNEEVLDNFDFYNTTVAFAVVWQPRLVPDTVVVDYGLDVVINVVENDILQNTVSGIGLGVDAYEKENIAINTGVSTTSKLGTNDLSIDGNTISIESETSVRFHQGDMEFAEPVIFYYETPVEFWEGSDPTEGYMYSSVTVIPATTIYYEDSFVDLESQHVEYVETVYQGGSGTFYIRNEDGTYTRDAHPVVGKTYYTTTWVADTTAKWVTAGTTVNATQAQDRPGKSQISATLDADNNYGYDAAYENMSEYSLGSAAKVTVNSESSATASFSFYGTGFDVISLTSNATGTLAVRVTDINGNIVKSVVVDTYYSYTKDANGNWVTASASDSNALYQVPVIQVEGLTYGKYNVVLTATYGSLFDHNNDGSYDLYLDAIRIYDPANDGASDQTIENAYKEDGEGWPSYTELRNNIISASKFNIVVNDDGSYTVTAVDGSEQLSGAIFIDGNATAQTIAEYVSYGPNNELYLDNGQAVAFNVTEAKNDPNSVADVQLGIKSATGAEVTYKINGVTYKVNTATDMYYSILKQAQAGTVIIENVSGGILSLTNIKVTYPSEPGDVNAANVLSIDEESAGFALMSLRRAPAVEPEVTEPTVPETEATQPETEATQPETEATQPETEETQPETEETQPETEETQPETEATQPETEPTEPEEDDSDVGSKVEETIRTIGKIIRKLFGWLFG